MQVRRCAWVVVAPRETTEFDLTELAAGDTGVCERLYWLALAAHCDDEISLDAAEVDVLGAIPPSHWQSLGDLSQRHPRVVLEALLAKGLLIAQEPPDAATRRFAQADAAVRAVQWRGLPAVTHRHTRWHGADTEVAAREFAATSAQIFLERSGPAPPVVRERVDTSRRLALSLARRFVAGQAYYAEAPLQIALVSRFERNFWKYRNHAKAYRAVILDAGHLSQMLYLAAAEMGLGAFITAAINEVEIEQAFGLEPMAEGPLCVCGFGVRAAAKTTVEFDPGHKVWPVG